MTEKRICLRRKGAVGRLYTNSLILHSTEAVYIGYTYLKGCCVLFMLLTIVTNHNVITYVLVSPNPLSLTSLDTVQHIGSPG